MLLRGRRLKMHQQLDPLAADAPVPVPVLHISGRSDHGGGPEHILHVIRGGSPDYRHSIACPANGLYWQRYADCLGEDRLCPIPHRTFSFAALARLRRYARRHGIRLIHSHGSCAGAYSRLLGPSLGIPVLHSFHGVPVTRSLKHSFYGLCESALARLTHCGIAVSAGEADLVHQRWRRYRGKLAVVPNGIDLDARQPAWSPWPRPGEPLRIVSFTRRIRQKNPELLIVIAARLRLMQVPFGIDAYGEGLDHPALAQEAQQHGLDGLLRFHAPTDAPGAVLAGAHIYLSTSRWEGMPLAVLEAWRAGLVVVASDVVGNRDLVRDGRTGRLFPNGDAGAAATIIEALHGDRADAEQLRARAQRSARLGHAHTLMAMRLEWLYRHLVEGCHETTPLTPIPLPRPAAAADSQGALQAIRVA